MISPKNIALNKPVTASSTYNNYTPNSVTDGVKSNDDLRWISSPDDDDVWIRIDLGKEYVVDEIKIYNGHKNGTTAYISSVKIEIGGKVVVDESVNKYEYTRKINLPDPKRTTDYVKLILPDGFNRIYEVEVYGSQRIIHESTTKKIKIASQEIQRLFHVNKVIWQGFKNPFIVDNNTYSRIITSFRDTKKRVDNSGGPYISSNDVELISGIRVRDISFTARTLDWEPIVVFRCDEIGFCKAYLCASGYSDPEELNHYENKTGLINKINSNVNKKWYFYFASYDRGDAELKTLKTWFGGFYGIELKIDYYGV